MSSSLVLAMAHKKKDRILQTRKEIKGADSWVAAKEFRLSYRNSETLLFELYVPMPVT